MAFATYDPADVSLSFGSVLITGGYMDGTFISVERNEDGSTLTKGAAGDGVRTISNNRSGMVTLTLQAESAFNDLLYAIYLADESRAADGVFPLSITNANGTIVAFATDAYIKKVPTMEFAQEASGREWVFECNEINFDIVSA